VLDEALMALHVDDEAVAANVVANHRHLQGDFSCLPGSAIIALALVVAPLRADAALRGLHPAFGGMQFFCLGSGLSGLETVLHRRRMRAVELLPWLRLAVVLLLGLEQLARVLQRLARRD